MQPMDTRMPGQTLIADVDDFLKRTGVPESTFGRMAINDWKLVRSLRAGRRVWPETEQKVRQYMAA
jgi:hypothetical protein